MKWEFLLFCLLACLLPAEILLNSARLRLKQPVQARDIHAAGNFLHSLSRRGGRLLLGGAYGGFDKISQHLRVTVGQYLRPSLKHLPVVRFYPPEEFEEVAGEARALGFRHVEAGPLVRSSYHAERQLGGCAAAT